MLLQYQSYLAFIFLFSVNTVSFIFFSPLFLYIFFPHRMHSAFLCFSYNSKIIYFFFYTVLNIFFYCLPFGLFTHYRCTINCFIYFSTSFSYVFTLFLHMFRCFFYVYTRFTYSTFLTHEPPSVSFVLRRGICGGLTIILTYTVPHALCLTQFDFGFAHSLHNSLQLTVILWFLPDHHKCNSTQGTTK